MSRNLTTRTKQVFGDVEKGTECRICGRNVTDGRSKYCSHYCRDLARGLMNFLNWASVKRRILDRDDRTCQECGFKQDWIDDGHDHMADIVMDQIPERPPSVSMLRLGSGEVSEEEVQKNQKQHDEWYQQRAKLIERYYRVDSDGLRLPSPEFRLEVDHIVPVADGGHPFAPNNLQTLCEECHKNKTSSENSARKGRKGRPDVERELAEFVEASAE